MKIVIIILFSLLIVSCGKKELLTYDIQKSYIYFGKPTKNLYTLSTDSNFLWFSFVFDPEHITEKTLVIPLHFTGLKQNYDRDVALKINTEETTVDLNLITIHESIIHANQYSDTLYIDVKRSPILKQDVFTLTLELQNNSSFNLGPVRKSKLRFIITDNLVVPPWSSDKVTYYESYEKQ